MVAPKGAPPGTPLFRGSDFSVPLRLPGGDNNDHFRSQITVVVSDEIGETQESLIYPVTVSRLCLMKTTCIEFKPIITTHDL